MRSPVDIRAVLAKRCASHRKQWLADCALGRLPDSFPLTYSLDVPTEAVACRNLEATRAWISQWKHLALPAQVDWTERRWSTLGQQKIPAAVTIESPGDLMVWVGQATTWRDECARAKLLLARWPHLAPRLPENFGMIADYTNQDFLRAMAMADWLVRHQDAGIYARQIPVAGLDTKWLEKHSDTVARLVASVLGQPRGSDLHAMCQLRRRPSQMTIRLLDPDLKRACAGLENITAPIEEIAQLDIGIEQAIVLENVVTGLALPALPRTVAILGLGNHISALGQLPWLQSARAIYWGDLDTFGFIILSRAREQVPHLQSLLMDRRTMDAHSELWVPEKAPYAGASPVGLTDAEARMYAWFHTAAGQNQRLEQERIAWDFAEREVVNILGRTA